MTRELRRVPWTCVWGRFAGSLEALEGGTPIALLPWICEAESTGEQRRVVSVADCEMCPRWEGAVQRIAG